MTIPLATGHRDAVVIPLPRTAPALSDNARYDEIPGQARLREAVTRRRLTALLATGGTEPQAWQADALCAETDPEEFFPEKGGSTRAAKKICTGCEVRDQCLEYAMANDERFGIWGGLSERERRRLRRTT